MQKSVCARSNLKFQKNPPYLLYNHSTIFVLTNRLTSSLSRGLSLPNPLSGFCKIKGYFLNLSTEWIP